MGNAAVDGARSMRYRGAGTMEFLLGPDRNFYFMEMNTRLQVEHPVTEMITGVDLVEAQFRVAAGEPLWLRQEDLEMKGHAIEVRINAEDPDHGFRPSPGRIQELAVPGGPGVRIDSHAYRGYDIPPFYDSLIGKLIVHAETRERACRRLERALHEFSVRGVLTTIPFHQRVLQNDRFKLGDVDTHFIDDLV
jgi:acetyl-CoA carboxylase biotin carboxylase subunit